ncbi:MAG: type II toxin-antitoxin system RelE/ParE family toxin [Alphaproteobacteria bacterium]|nr:type II toxin-antitoxin system RelE/ParE family toxin [Alphaproteobacteria bacterium]
MRRLRVAGAARRDLAAISAFTTERWGRTKARQYLQLLEDTFRSLLRHPGLGVARADLGTRLRSIGSGSHVVIYVDDGEIIDVLRVLHAAMDIEQVVRDEPATSIRRRPRRRS